MVALLRADPTVDNRFIMLAVDVAWHPWVLERCREVEAAPDEHLDLWSRGHFKSTIITFAGVAQYVLKDPNKCVCILSYKTGAAQAFLQQIMTAFETKEVLLKCFPDVLYPEVKSHQGPHWSASDGIVLKRTTSKKESTIDISGFISGMKTGGHYDLLVYDEGRPVLLSQAEYDKKKREMTSKDWASQMLQTPVARAS